MSVMAVTAALWGHGVVPGGPLLLLLATSTLILIFSPTISCACCGSGPASPILSSPIASSSPVSSSSPTTSAIGGYLGLVLGVKGWKGLIGVVDSEGRDGDLLAGFIKFVSGFEDLLVSLFCEIHSTYV